MLRGVLPLILFLAGWNPHRALAGRTPLHIGGFLPRSGNGFPVYPQTYPALTLAVDLINNSTNLLPDSHLILDVYDTEHSAAVGMKRFLEMINSNSTTIFLLGPATSSVSIHVCVAAPSWNLVQVSFSGYSPALENRDLYPSFFRTIPSDAMLNSLRYHFLRHYGWQRVAIVYEDHPTNVYYQSLKKLTSRLLADGMDIVLFEAMDTKDYGNTVRALKAVDARITMVHALFINLQKFFCEAYSQGMQGPRHVWMLAGWTGNDWWTEDVEDPRFNCTAQEMAAMLEGHFSFTYMSFTADNTTVLGMTVREFRDTLTRQMGRVTEYTAYAFDAMLTVAHVLHTASHRRGLDLSQFTYDSQHFSDIFVEEIMKLDFVGISGPVGFDAVGNRLGLTVLEQCQGGKRHVVGTMEPRSESLVMESDRGVVWPGNLKPRDGPLRSRSARFLPLSAIVSISVLSAVGFITTCVFIGINCKLAHLKVIKLSSPNMNTVVALGCSLGYVSVVLSSLDGRQLQPDTFAVMCHVPLFILCVAYSLAFGALFLKTWRVHRIMANKKLAKLKVKDHHLVAWTLGLVGLDLVFLAVWLALDPRRPVVVPLPVEIDPQDSDLILEPYLEKCTCQHQEYWLGATLCYKGVLLLFGLFLAWETRNIQVQALNDSKYIGMSVYNLAIISVVGVPVGFIISDEYFVANYVISSLFVIIAVTITLCFVFVPKLYSLHTNPTGDVDVRFSQRAPTQPGSLLDTELSTGVCTLGSRVTPMSQAAHNIATQHRLEKMVAERDSQITDLQKRVSGLTQRLSNSPPESTNA